MNTPFRVDGKPKCTGCMKAEPVPSTSEQRRLSEPCTCSHAFGDHKGIAGDDGCSKCVGCEFFVPDTPSASVEPRVEPSEESYRLCPDCEDYKRSDPVYGKFSSCECDSVSHPPLEQDILDCAWRITARCGISHDCIPFIKEELDTLVRERSKRA